MGGYGQKRMRMLVAIALVALILGAVSGVVFRKVMVVKNIVVEGVDDETANTARALSGIRLGQSVFDIDERQIAINLREDGYIKLCSVEVQRPDTVILNLKKRVGVAAFEHLGFTYIVDSELSVLECVGALSGAGVMIVTGRAYTAHARGYAAQRGRDARRYVKDTAQRGRIGRDKR